MGKRKIISKVYPPGYSILLNSLAYATCEDSHFVFFHKHSASFIPLPHYRKRSQCPLVRNCVASYYPKPQSILTVRILLATVWIVPLDSKHQVSYVFSVSSSSTMIALDEKDSLASIIVQHFNISRMFYAENFKIVPSSSNYVVMALPTLVFQDIITDIYPNLNIASDIIVLYDDIFASIIKHRLLNIIALTKVSNRYLTVKDRIHFVSTEEKIKRVRHQYFCRI
uniref:Reverse transcriptase domain-containing protein n=1 Tax=Heterorhabditis bacteriophora TaxID=37862 RepID=A0A1I7W8C0_HETBA